MITLKEWMEVVEYRVTEGSVFQWQCYGPNAYALDSWNGDQDGSSSTIIFDTKTQEVYEVQSHDYNNQRAYRLVNPDYKDQRNNESNRLNVPLDEAWDEVNYVDLEADDDWIQKALAIVAGEDYDTRVSIPIDLPEDELMVLFKMAHAADMTFNAYVEQALRQALADDGFIGRLKEKASVSD